jgi:hypothetical protein
MPEDFDPDDFGGRNQGITTHQAILTMAAAVIARSDEIKGAPKRYAIPAMMRSCISGTREVKNMRMVYWYKTNEGLAGEISIKCRKIRKPPIFLVCVIQFGQHNCRDNQI